jgi:putative transcriptional regulator
MHQKSCEILLMEYAAGTLDCAHNVLVASYLTLSPEGRRYVSECETLAAALMEHGCECAEMSNTCLDAVMAKIDCNSVECAEEECNAPCPVENCAIIPQPLSRAIPSSAKKQWRKAFGGLEWLDVKFEGSPGKVRLMRCKPGFVLPHHTHTGPEITLVLDGAFEDSSGRYTRGTLVFMDEGSAHQPAADAKDGCVVLTIWQSPIRFTGLLHRFLNPLV